jgi:hypothetical protein
MKVISAAKYSILCNENYKFFNIAVHGIQSKTTSPIILLFSILLIRNTKTSEPLTMHGFCIVKTFIVSGNYESGGGYT